MQHDALGLASITERLLEDAKKVLLLPCSYLLGPLSQVVRTLAREQGKEADLRVHGEDIEIDRRVLDELKYPLIHVLRNCVDHGIEIPETRRELGKADGGTITITVKPVEGNRVEVTVADDGSGIDPGRSGTLPSASDSSRRSRPSRRPRTIRASSSSAPACRRARSSPTCRGEDSAWRS